MWSLTQYLNNKGGLSDRSRRLSIISVPTAPNFVPYRHCNSGMILYLYSTFPDVRHYLDIIRIVKVRSYVQVKPSPVYILDIRTTTDAGTL